MSNATTTPSALHDIDTLDVVPAPAELPDMAPTTSSAPLDLGTPRLVPAPPEPPDTPPAGRCGTPELPGLEARRRTRERDRSRQAHADPAVRRIQQAWRAGHLDLDLALHLYGRARSDAYARAGRDLIALVVRDVRTVAGCAALARQGRAPRSDPADPDLSPNMPRAVACDDGSEAYLHPQEGLLDMAEDTWPRATRANSATSDRRNSAALDAGNGAAFGRAS